MRDKRDAYQQAYQRRFDFLVARGLTEEAAVIAGILRDQYGEAPLEARPLSSPVLETNAPPGPITAARQRTKRAPAKARPKPDPKPPASEQP